MGVAVKTKVINGVKCMPLKNGEARIHGDVFVNGREWLANRHFAVQDIHTEQCYRPIKRYTKPTAKPKAKATGIEAAVCADIAERQRKGIAKYGTTVAENQLTDLQWNRHLYEELLDAAVYLRKIIANMEAKGK